MKNLKVLLEDNSGILLAWDKINLATDYTILGKDDTFNDFVIDNIKDNSIFLSKDKLENVVALTVEYNYSDGYKGYTVDRTNTYFRKNNGYKILLVQCIESYYGISISYASNDIYDKYYIYEKVGDKSNKIIETEDFQICSNRLKRGHTYYIEAFIKNENDEYLLGGKSLEFVCEPTSITYSGVDPKVSVIIPAYNAQLLLPRALDSIIYSSLKDIEVIVLNDGSKDDTYNIMEWYKNKYPELFTIIDKENEGAALTRTKGLDYAHAKYTFFMDADDMVHINMLKNMYDCLVEEDADFAMNKVIVRQDVDITEIYFNKINNIASGKRYIVKNYSGLINDKINRTYDNIYLVTLWHQMGKTELYRAHPMPNFHNYEDIAYVRILSSYADKFVFHMDAYYVWDRRYGLYYTSYSKKSERYDKIETKVKMFVESAFYFINDVNMDRLGYLYLDAIMDVAEYVENTIKAVDVDHYTYNRDNLYIELVYPYLKMYDVLNLPQVRQNEKAYNIAEGIIRLVENSEENEEQ